MPEQPIARRAGANRHLTSFAQGYTNQQFVGEFVAPTVFVTERSGLFLQFDMSRFEQSNDTRSAGSTFGVVDYSYEGKPYRLNPHGLKYTPALEEVEEANVLNINLGEEGANLLMEKTMLNMEIERAEIATNPANYATNNTAALSGTSQVSNAACDLDALVNAAKGEVNAAIAKDPNVWLLSYEAFMAVTKLDIVKDKIKYTSRQSVTTDMLAEMYGFSKVVVGSALKKTTTSSPPERVWGNTMVFCYTNPAALASGRLPFSTEGGAPAVRRQQPSFAYQYMLQDRPQMTNRYWDESTDSWCWKIRSDRDTAIVGVDSAGKANSAFLYTNVVA